MPGKVLPRIGDPSTAGGSVDAALAGSASELPDVVGPHAQADRLIAQCSARPVAGGTADPLAVIAQAMQLPDPQKAHALRGMIPAIALNRGYEQSLFPFLEPLRSAVREVEAPQARYELTHALAGFFSEYSLERDVTRVGEHGHASQQSDAFFQRLQSDCRDLLYEHALSLVPLQSAPAPAGGAAVPSVAADPTAIAAEIDGMLASGLYLVNGAGQRAVQWQSMFADAVHSPVETRHAALVGLAGAVRHLVGRPAQLSAIEAMVQAAPALAGVHQASVIGKLAQQQSPDGRHGFADGPVSGLYHCLRALSLMLEGAHRREALKHVIGMIDAEPANNRPALLADMLMQVDASAPADQAPLLTALANRLWRLDTSCAVFDGLLARVRCLPPALQAAPLEALINNLEQIEPDEQRHIRVHQCASLTQGLPVEAQLAPLKSLFAIDAMPEDAMQMANLQQKLQMLALQPAPTQAALLKEKYLDLEKREDYDVASDIRLQLMQAYDHSAAGLPADLKLPVLQAACTAAGWLSGSYMQIAFQRIMTSANSLPPALHSPLHKSVVQAFGAAASETQDCWQDDGLGATLLDTAAILPPPLKGKVLLQLAYWLRFSPEHKTAFDKVHALAADLPATTQATLDELLSDADGDRSDPSSP